MAEFYRLIGWHGRAALHYEKGVEAAQESQWMRQSALIIETAFVFHHQFSIKKLARVYWADCQTILQRWGAHARIQWFKEKYGHAYQETGSYLATNSAPIVSTVQASVESLDFQTLTKTSQALIGEVRLEALLKRLMESLLENAGADRVALVLAGAKGQFFVAMVADADQGASEVLDDALDSSAQLASSLVRAVIRSRKAIIIQDVRTQFEFLEDPYFAEHPVLSLLCVPMINQGNMRGVVYLENRLSKGAFTNDRTQMVEILASQASVSIENAKLYEQLESRVIERTRDIRSILSNIRQGIFTISNQSFAIDNEYSEFLTTILEGSPIAGVPLSQSLFAGSDLSSDTISSIEQSLAASIGEDRIAFELNAIHFPREIQKQSRGQRKILEIDWHPIVDELSITRKLLVVVRDVSSVRILQEEAHQRSLEMARISEIAEVPATRLDQFFLETWDYLAACQTSLSNYDDYSRIIGVFARHFHTIKGMARSLNLSQLAEHLHESESTLLALDRNSDPRSLLAICFQDIQSSVSQYEATLQKLRRLFHVNHEANAEIPGIKDLELDLDSMASQTAVILGKPIPVIVFSMERVSAIEPRGLRLLRGILVHLVRNSLDHGIESAQDRLKVGKPENGQIKLQLMKRSQDWLLTFADDGRGLNLQRIRQRALALGIISSHAQLSSEEIAELIFRSEFSTSDSVSEISGRGIGLDAVHHELKDQEGAIHIVLAPSDDPECVPFIFEISLPLSIFSSVDPNLKIAG